MSIYIQTGKDRRVVPSLRPFLRESLSQRMVMDPTQMNPRDVALCPWVGWGIGKGIPHLQDDVSVFAVPSQLKSGLHGELVKGFLGYPLDPYKDGFNGFIRWVYFADPLDHMGRSGVLGIDWSLVMAQGTGSQRRCEMLHLCPSCMCTWYSAKCRTCAS